MMINWTRNILVALVKLANKGCRKLRLVLDRSPDLVLPTTVKRSSWASTR